jgi:hypothetical protein
MVSPVVSISVAEMVATVVPVVASSAIIVVLSWILLKFSLSDATLVFEATDFEARADDNTYEVEITASKAGKNNTTQVFVVFRYFQLR